MTNTAWEVPDADISNWIPTARYFATSDNKYFIVDADTAPVPGWIKNVIRRCTAVFWCTENAGVTDLNPDYEYPPGTTPEQAVELMGYTLTGAP